LASAEVFGSPAFQRLEGIMAARPHEPRKPPVEGVSSKRRSLGRWIHKSPGSTTLPVVASDRLACLANPPAW
jgi:hypothetical protein